MRPNKRRNEAESKGRRDSENKDRNKKETKTIMETTTETTKRSAKKVLIISTSPRRNSNSDRLATEFAHGAEQAGNEVEIVRLRERKIAFCRGCMACQKGDTHQCVIGDDAVRIGQKMHDAEVIVWATPIYYYSVSGQMKTMIDRANPLYDTDYRFRETYLLASAAEDEETTVEGAVKTLQGWVDCFPRLCLKGVIFAGGVNDTGEIEGHPALEEARRAGQSIG